MPNTIRLQAISNSAGTIAVPIVELQERTIQSFSATYTGGEWNPNTSYNWIPGSFVDFTPRRPDSRITYYYRAPHAWVASSHAISHWRFFVNGRTWFWHNTSGTHIEDACTFRWDFPSWGTTNGRIGYQMRSYADDNHEIRMNTTYYWDGGGRSAQNCFSQIVVEEYVGGPDEDMASNLTLRAEPFVAR
jgi:hypothetical protein